MPQRWQVLPEPPQSFFDEFPELPRTVARLLYHRNLRTQEAIDEFLYPEYSDDVHDPFLFRDMKKTVDRLFLAMERNEKIAIHGDYDADGVSGSVVLTSLFHAFLYTNITVFLPHRELDGYGLNKRTVQLLADDGVTVIISCDCGISNREEVELANSLGIDVIITDHHTIPSELPPAYAIIHPKIDGEPYPDKGLAGGGVAFKLLQAMLREHKKQADVLPNGDTHESFEKWQLDMVAIASVADMVPLVGESRTLTKYGLLVLNKTKRIGLRKLLIESKLMDEQGVMKRPISADTIGFHIAPRINAAGRMDHANVAYKLLTAKGTIEAIDLAFLLEQNNIERQQATEQILGEAIEQIESRASQAPIIFVLGNTWSPGIVGLIASRLKDRYHKPTIVMSGIGEQIMGSGRSVPGFNMIQSMQEIPEFFLKFGGHPMACGFTLRSREEREVFEAALIKKYEEKTKDVDMTPTLLIDADIDLDSVTWELYDTLEKFKPFGMANESPLYLARGVTVVSFSPMGKDNQHLRLMVRHRTSSVKKVVGWNLCSSNNIPNWCQTLAIGDTIDMVCKIDVNEWNGNRELQLTIVDMKKTE